MNDRIQQLADRARDHIPTLLLGMRDRIEAAITDALETAREDDAKAVLRIPVTITWDLDSVGVRITATVSTRCKAEVTVQLDDDQPRLPLDGDAQIGREFARRVTEAGGTLTVGGSHE